MVIRARLSEASFDEADVRRLTAAYEASLELLQLKNVPDPLTNLIAEKIIDVFQAGERDPAKICAAVLKELNAPLPDGP